MHRITGNPCQRRIDGIAFQIETIPKPTSTFVHRVDPPCRVHDACTAGRAAHVKCHAPLRPTSKRQCGRCDCLKYRLLGNTINHAPCTATPKNHAAWPFEYFHALQIVKVAKYLRVVADPVYVEICGGAVAAQDYLISISLALMRVYARYVAKYVGEALHRLIFHQHGGNNRDRRRDFPQRHVGFCEC